MPSQPLVKRRSWRSAFEFNRSSRGSSKPRAGAASSPGPGGSRWKISQRPGSTANRGSTSFASSHFALLRRTTPAVEFQQTPLSHAASVCSEPNEQSITPEDDEAVDERENEDSINEIAMAVDLRNRDTVGCCYYVARDEGLYILSDVKLGGTDVVETLKTTIQPTTILLSARIDGKIDEVLDPNSIHTESSSSEDAFALPYALEVRPSMEFNYEDGKRRLSELRLATTDNHRFSLAVPGDDDPYDSYNFGLEAGFTSRQGRLLHLSTLIDFDSRLSIGCAAALVLYLQRRRAQKFLPGDAKAQSMFRIASIEMFNLDKVMYVNSDTLAALQIMEMEAHPHAEKQGPNSTGSKESLSVYGLFHRLAKTPQGKQRLRQMFLRPTLDLEVITERQTSVAIFLRSSNEDHTRALVKSLKSVKNMRPVMIHLRKGMSGGIQKSNAIKSGVWTTIRAFAFYTLEIVSRMRQLECYEPLKIRSKVIETFDVAQIRRVGHDINTVVDFSTSAEEGRTIIMPGIDDDLDTLKRNYAGIDHLLSQISNDVIKDFEYNAGDVTLNVVTYPQIGFLIALQRNPSTGQFPLPPNLINGVAWERIFCTAEVHYYKDARTHELDQRFGDIAGSIYDREIEIAFDLGQRVLEHQDLLCKMSDICGELDTLIALSQGANCYRLTQPRVVNENLIDIQGGRHILQEQVTPKFIANNTILVGGAEEEEDSENEGLQKSSPPRTNLLEEQKSSMLIITGPNYSGKSVYLKQVALIVFLAHVGSFVPALSATIGLTDKILTRISTRETVSKQHSAFMIDVQQIASAITMHTKRSLVVIDEFGKGTEAADGAGLACSVFQNLLDAGATRPKVIAATHFHEIFEHGLLRPSPYLALAHMAVLVSQDGKAEDQVTYLYELQPGRGLDSYGTVCAAMNGIGLTIVQRATDIICLHASGNLFEPHMSLTDRERISLTQAEDIGRLFLMQDFGTLEDDNEGSDPRLFLHMLKLELQSDSSILED